MVTSNKQNANEDVEMKNVDSPNANDNLMISAGDTNGKNTMITNGDPDLLTLEDIKEHAKHIEKYVSTKETRFMLRVLRTLVSTRKKLNHKVLRKLITSFYTNSQTAKDGLLEFIDEPMETDNLSTFKARTGKSTQPILPELDVYFHLLILLHLIDLERYEQAIKCSDQLMKKITSQNRRTLDLLASKCYFYHLRCYELTNKMNQIKPFLHSRLRTALYVMIMKDKLYF